MSRRNLIFILLAGLVLMMGAAGAAQRDAERGEGETTSTAAPAPQAGGGAEANLVEGDLPADRTIRAHVGDDVELRVASSTPDVAELQALGVHTAVGPQLPGTLRFRALSPGRFPVTYEVAGTTAGELVVSEPAAGQDGEAAP